MMSPSAFFCLKSNEYFSLFLSIYFINTCHAWLPDTSTKLTNTANKISSITFKGNGSFPDYFTVLYQDDNTILLGGRNRVYNLSTYDFSERKSSSLYWPSSDAHLQLCSVKGKKDDHCQNYIRLLFYTGDIPGKILVCGTNSYKPMCRYFVLNKNNAYVIEKEIEGVGLCPYDPDHNSTALYSNGHLFSATVGDFSGGEALIYREPLKTEPSDLRQLNAPNFVSSLTYRDYIYFFYREPAVEYMNCGKVIYSRVARVCKHDKGGPHLSKDKWTTFTKARLNCSVPGEYPFYFDEIQSTTGIINGTYSGKSTKIIYSTLTTPTNAIGGSAICVFQMGDIETAFKGPFKYQDGINSNWLPVPESKVPSPRPGECVEDSRLLPDQNVNFIKTHPLMEKAIPAMHGRPILIRVSLNYRFTAIAVEEQVRTVDDETFDVIYVGTDDGRVLKVVNIPLENSSKAIVISENEVFSRDNPVRQLRITPGYGKVVAVSKREVKLVTINHCGSMTRCSDCIELRDPHCAWDPIKSACVSVDEVTLFRFLIQDVKRGSTAKCKAPLNDKKEQQDIDDNIISNSINEENDTKDSDKLSGIDIESPDCNDVNSDIKTGCSVQKKSESTSDTFQLIIIGTAVAGLIVGFFCGYCVSRRFHVPNHYPSFVEQHNHLERVTVNQNSFLAKPKTVNLDVLNVSTDSLPPKKDNTGSLKNLNNEGTLQKIKKTYI